DDVRDSVYRKFPAVSGVTAARDESATLRSEPAGSSGAERAVAGAAAASRTASPTLAVRVRRRRWRMVGLLVTYEGTAPACPPYGQRVKSATNSGARQVMTALTGRCPGHTFRLAGRRATPRTRPADAKRVDR